MNVRRDYLAEPGLGSVDTDQRHRTYPIRYSIWLETDMAESIRQIAKQCDGTVSDIVRLFLQEGINEYGNSGNTSK
jgi:hypothetical protein